MIRFSEQRRLGIILNRSAAEIQHNSYRSLKIAFSAIESAIKYVDPKYLVNKTIKLKGSSLKLRDLHWKTLTLNLGDIDSIYLVGAGKATATMAETLQEIFKERISGGSINVPYGTSVELERVEVVQANHPIPDQAGVNGTKKIIRILKNTKKSDLIFVLISGGGSALMPHPAKGLRLSDKQQVTDFMISSGASIHEINVVRKHLSMIKGGQLIRLVESGSTVVSLILSDVIGDNLDVIASGPTLPDHSTFKDAAQILKKYKLWNNGSGHLAAQEVISRGLQGIIRDTPKPGDPIFSNVHNLLIGNNVLICQKMMAYLRKQGLQVENLGSSFNGEARIFGGLLSKLANNIKLCDKPTAFILGGETIVNLHPTKEIGLGGRNQEAALAAALSSNFSKKEDTSIVCLGTDGIDGNSGAAGGFVTPKTASAIMKKKSLMKKYLDKHDSYHALKELDSLILTGWTGTNVNDVSIICSLK
jgi:glycerate 2-kinase